MAVEAPPATLEDGRLFAPMTSMWRKYQSGSVFCYDPGIKDNTCGDIEYAETATPSKIVIISVRKWNDLEKQVIRSRMTLKGEYVCSTSDDWSVEHATFYTTVDDVAKIQGTDISGTPESVARWRNDLRERWAGFMGQEFCFRFALRRDAQGETHGGEFEEFKYSEGIRQAAEKPVYVNTYERSDLSRLHLRPEN